METKVCPKCGRELPLSGFSNNRSKKDGKASYCKECTKEYNIKNKEKRKEYLKEYSIKNKEKRKEYLAKNKERIKEKNKKYRENNKERRNEYLKEYMKNRRKEDELYAVSLKCRSRIYHFIQKRGYIKTSKTFEMIGCTSEQLVEHLHKTWYDNYGTEYNGEPVHIDHIIPLSSAETEEDVYKLCHYTNLQYLKPEDNLAKSDKILQTI